MAIFGMVLALLAMLGGGAYWIDSNADERGFKRAEAICLENDKEELVTLNNENAELINLYNLGIAENRRLMGEKEGKANVELAKIKEQRDTAVSDLAVNLRVQSLSEENRAKDEAAARRKAVIAHINGLEGTEGSKLSPKTRYDLEQLSLNADETAVLLGLCQDTLEADRETGPRIELQ